MAQEKKTVGLRIDPDTKLWKRWEDYADEYEHSSDALRDIMRTSLCEEDTSTNVTRGVRAGLVTLLVLFLGQSHLVYGSQISMPLVAVALIAFSIVLVAPMSVNDVFPGDTHE